MGSHFKNFDTHAPLKNCFSSELNSKDQGHFCSRRFLVFIRVLMECLPCTVLGHLRGGNDFINCLLVSSR